MFFSGQEGKVSHKYSNVELAPDTYTVDVQMTYNGATYENAHYHYVPNIREKPSRRLFGTAFKMCISYLGYQRKRLEIFSLSSWPLFKIGTITMV